MLKKCSIFLSGTVCCLHCQQASADVAGRVPGPSLPHQPGPLSVWGCLPLLRRRAACPKKTLSAGLRTRLTAHSELYMLRRNSRGAKTFLNCAVCELSSEIECWKLLLRNMIIWYREVIVSLHCWNCCCFVLLFNKYLAIKKLTWCFWNYPCLCPIFSQHFQRQFLDRDGSVRQEDSNVLLITADYLDIGPVMSAVPQLGEALKPWPCSGVFCGVPSSLPLMKYLELAPQDLSM